MTTTEFSQAFDAQISAYNESIDFATSDKGLSFGEYEKSVFLTRAQDELVLAFYSGKNSYNEGFENTEEVRRYLSQLVNTAKIEEDKQEIRRLTDLLKQNTVTGNKNLAMSATSNIKNILKLNNDDADYDKFINNIVSDDSSKTNDIAKYVAKIANDIYEKAQHRAEEINKAAEALKGNARKELDLVLS